MQPTNRTVGLVPLTRASTQPNWRADLINQVQVIAESNPGKARELHRRILFCTWNRFELQKLQREGLDISKVVPIKGLPGGGDMKMVVTAIITCAVVSSIFVYFYLLEAKRDEQFQKVMNALHARLEAVVEKTRDNSNLEIVPGEQFFSLRGESARKQKTYFNELEFRSDHTHKEEIDLTDARSLADYQHDDLEEKYSNLESDLDGVSGTLSSAQFVALPRDVMEELAQVFLNATKKDTADQADKERTKLETESMVSSQLALQCRQSAEKLDALENSLERKLGETPNQFFSGLDRRQKDYVAAQCNQLSQAINTYSRAVATSLSAMKQTCVSLVHTADFAPQRISPPSSCEFSVQPPQLFTSWGNSWTDDRPISYEQLQNKIITLQDVGTFFHQNIVDKITSQLAQLFAEIATFDNTRKDPELKALYKAQIDLTESSFIKQIDDLQGPLTSSFKAVQADNKSKLNQSQSLAATRLEMNNLIAPARDCTKFWNNNFEQPQWSGGMSEPSLDIESFYLLNSPDASSPGEFIKDTHAMFSVPAFIGETPFSLSLLVNLFSSVSARLPVKLEIKNLDSSNQLHLDTGIASSYYLLSKNLLDDDNLLSDNSRLPPLSHVLISMLQNYIEGEALSPHPLIRIQSQYSFPLYINVAPTRIIVTSQNLFPGMRPKTYRYFPLN